jgi:hypothetical protein
MNTWVMLMALAGHQYGYTGDTDAIVRFESYEACAKVAITEMSRLSPKVRGEFVLYCMPASVLGDLDT